MAEPTVQLRSRVLTVSVAVGYVALPTKALYPNMNKAEKAITQFLAVVVPGLVVAPTAMPSIHSPWKTAPAIKMVRRPANWRMA